MKSDVIVKVQESSVSVQAATKNNKKKLMPGKNENLKDIEEVVVVVDEYLGTKNLFKTRIDLDSRIGRALDKLGSSIELVEKNGKGGVKTKKVTTRMLLTEFLLDGLDKYNKGEGKYPFAKDEEWSWTKK